MSGPVTLPPMICRRCGSRSELCQNGNGYQRKLQDVKRWDPKNPNFSQREKIVFRKSGWLFSIPMQPACEMQNNKISSVFRKQIWCFFTKLAAEENSKWTVAHQEFAGLVNLYSTSDESKQGKQI